MPCPSLKHLICGRIHAPCQACPTDWAELKASIWYKFCTITGWMAPWRNGNDRKK